MIKLNTIVTIYVDEVGGRSEYMNFELDPTDLAETFSAVNHIIDIKGMDRNKVSKINVLPADDEMLAWYCDNETNNQYDPSEPQSWGPSDHYDYY